MIAKVEEKLESLAKTVFDNKVWFYLQNVIITVLFFFTIKGLTDYDNAFYQTWKYKEADQFLLAFTLILFLVRKVRLLNLPSLAATLIFVPVAIRQLANNAEYADIYAILQYEVVVEWVTLMIVVDLIFYKKFNDLSKVNTSLLFMYAIFAVAMLFHRNNRNEPLYLLFPLGLLIFIKISEETWDNLIKCFISGWLLTFIYTIIRCAVDAPYRGGRYYGYFVNIGSFGMYLCCTFLVALLAFYFTRERLGRKSPLHIASIVWMVATLVFFVLIDTRTMFAGLAMIILFVYLFNGKEADTKAILSRVLKLLCVVVGICVLMAVTFIIFLNVVDKADYAAIRSQAGRAGIWSPWTRLLGRMAGFAEEADTSSLKRMIVSAIDLYSSGRITIIKAFSEYFNFNGNPSMYLEVDGYYAFSAHNNYTQVLVDYGYSAATAYFVLVAWSLGYSIKRFLLRGRKAVDMIPMLWIAMCLGLWIGEACWIVFPATFFMLVFICRLISQDYIDKKEDLLNDGGLDETIQ